MSPAAQRILFSTIQRTNSLVFLILCVTSVSIQAKSSSGRVVCREDISLEHRNKLSSSLRQITGVADLFFDDNGALNFNPSVASGGSVTARSLLQKAVFGSNAIVIEDASARSDVVFARVVPAIWRHHAGLNARAFVVLIDFADFNHLIGDDPALRAFDVGWALLHELDHVVENSADPNSAGIVGECEAHLNRMRQECGLPQRADYFHTLWPAAGINDFKTQFVRLSFVQPADAENPKKQYCLIWDARLVGGIEETRVATLR